MCMCECVCVCVCVYMYVCVCMCVLERYLHVYCIRIDHVMISHPLPHSKRGAEDFKLFLMSFSQAPILQQRAGRRGGFMCSYDLYLFMGNGSSVIGETCWLVML